MIKTLIKRNQSKQIVINQSGNYTIKLCGTGAHAEIIGGFLS